MDYSLHQKNQGLCVEMKGSFTFNDNAKFKQIIEMLEEEAPRFLEISFAGVDFIDSAGLGMLLLLRDTCQKKNLSLTLSHANGQVEKIFLISKFDQLFSFQAAS